MKNINDVYNELLAVKMINNILIGCLASSSPELKDALRSSLEALLSSAYKLPGDFSDQANMILKHVCGAHEPKSPEESTRTVLRLLKGGLEDSDDRS